MTKSNTIVIVRLWYVVCCKNFESLNVWQNWLKL